jgi:hypothetical protein
MTIKPALLKILKGICHTGNENKHSHERMRTIKSQEKSRQVIRELHKINCIHTNPDKTKPTK